MSKYLGSIVISLCLILLQACGGGVDPNATTTGGGRPNPGGVGGTAGDGAGGPGGPTVGGPVTPLSAQFLDSGVVQGLDYSSPAGINGVTDSNGMFNFVPGDDGIVTFSIGNIVLGSAEVGANFGTDFPVVTPVELVDGSISGMTGETAENNPTVTNITRFLQTLDDDGDPSNGILINETVRMTASGNFAVNFDQTTEDFEIDPFLFAALTGLTPSTTAGFRGLVATTVARSNLRPTLFETLAGFYQGVFLSEVNNGTVDIAVDENGNITGSAEGNSADFVLTGSLESDGMLENANFGFGIDFEGQFMRSGEASGTFEENGTFTLFRVTPPQQQ